MLVKYLVSRNIHQGITISGPYFQINQVKSRHRNFQQVAMGEFYSFRNTKCQTSGESCIFWLDALGIQSSFFLIEKHWNKNELIVVPQADRFIDVEMLHAKWNHLNTKLG